MLGWRCSGFLDKLYSGAGDEANEQRGQFPLRIGCSVGFLFASRAMVMHIKLVNGPGKFLKGQLLLDSGQLGGSFFQRTVVLICQHDAEGAFGLVLNRSLGKKVGEMIVADLPDTLRESPLYLGGPVQPTALSFLHTDNFLPEADVMPNLALGHSLDDLVEVGESFSIQKKVKLFAGYAGWSAGQLEDEIKRRAWVTFPASLELVFDTPPEQLWSRILKRKGGWKNKLLSQMPENLAWN